MELKTIIDGVLEQARVVSILRYHLDKALTYQLWDASTPEQRRCLSDAVAKKDTDAVKLWIRKHPATPYRDMSWRQLIEIAKKLRIPNYSRLLRAELIEEILHEQGRDAEIH